MNLRPPGWPPTSLRQAWRRTRQAWRRTRQAGMWRHGAGWARHFHGLGQDDAVPAGCDRPGRLRRGGLGGEFREMEGLDRSPGPFPAGSGNSAFMESPWFHSDLLAIHEPGRAAFPGCRFGGLSSPPDQLGAGKPPEPAAWKGCPTGFMETAILRLSHAPILASVGGRRWTLTLDSRPPPSPLHANACFNPAASCSYCGSEL